MWIPRRRTVIGPALSLVVASLGAVNALAQVPAGAPASAPAAGPRLSAGELEKLVAPVALYPDDLLAILLPAATTPLDVVKAQRFLDQRKANPNLQPDPKLSEPVRNLLNYPDVIKKMSDDLDWTVQLGEAIVNQQRDVMESIQAFRRKVHAAGNLKTDDKQIVVVEKEVVKVVQANPQVIYVPQYQPSVVVVPQPAPPVVYYPTPYPVYYYPYPPGATFATGFFVGAATAYAFSWTHHSIHHHYDIEELQAERIDYARESREDWQSHQRETQSQRQQATQERRTQRQDAVSSGQAQRQQTQSERQAGAGAGRPGGDTWRPQQQSAQPGTTGTQRSARPGDSQFQGGGQGAFSGMGSGRDAASQAQRGFESRSAGGRQASMAAGGGSRSGGGRGGGGRRR
jgi:Protein of unknown function (DUF3300)